MSADLASARSDQVAAFCERGDWKGAELRPLAGDASNRRYFRLSHSNLGTAVLMDAPPETGEDIRPFVSIAQHLGGLGLSAPRIYDQDPKQGFLLLEDLGDDLFARVLDRQPELEDRLYIAATDALIAAQTADPPNDLPDYGPSEMTQAAALAFDWYVAHVSQDTPSPNDRTALLDAVARSLSALTGPRVLVQRDYHAENLLWLPERDGPAQTGLLDFQDAALGHPAYDLASLLVDVRRTVSAGTKEAALSHYLAQTGHDPDRFRQAFATLSAQRNLRILGVFTRLCIRDGKDSYPGMLPLVWSNLQSDLAHPSLSALRDVVAKVIPPVTEDIVAKLKARNAG